MEQRKEAVNRSTIALKNARAKHQITSIIKRAENLKTDPEKQKRLEMNLCLCCYYVNNTRIGGAAITHRPCGLCERDMSFGSTATDVVCSDCAEANNLCKQCGADIELKNRTKKHGFESKRENQNV